MNKSPQANVFPAGKANFGQAMYRSLERYSAQAVASWDWDELAAFGATKGMEWKFVPADAPWQNGASEALVKSVKKAITVAVGESVMTFSELQTVCYEAANLVNERPIGIGIRRYPKMGLTCALTISF